MEIWDEQIAPPDGRSNPRVVKKPRSKFPSKKHDSQRASVKLQPLNFNILNPAGDRMPGTTVTLPSYLP